MTALQTDQIAVHRDTTITFTGETLGKPMLHPGGSISVGEGIHFVDLDALDAVIGHLSSARFEIASARLAAESARRDSTPRPHAAEVPCRDYDRCGNETTTIGDLCFECEDDDR